MPIGTVLLIHRSMTTKLSSGAEIQAVAHESCRGEVAQIKGTELSWCVACRASPKEVGGCTAARSPVVKLAAAASERELLAFHERKTTAACCDFCGFTAFARAVPSAEIIEVLEVLNPARS